jgi:hypothetical protein
LDLHTRGSKIFQTVRSHVKILGDRRVIQSQYVLIKEGKVISVRSMNVNRSGDIAPPILNFGARWK